MRFRWKSFLCFFRFNCWMGNRQKTQRSEHPHYGTIIFATSKTQNRRETPQWFTKGKVQTFTNVLSVNFSVSDLRKNNSWHSKTIISLVKFWKSRPEVRKVEKWWVISIWKMGRYSLIRFSLSDHAIFCSRVAVASSTFYHPVSAGQISDHHIEV